MTLKALTIIASFELLLLASSANAACPPAYVLDMRNHGVPPAEIERICGGNVPQFSDPDSVPMSTSCQTGRGVCRMKQPNPVGAQCWCRSPSGSDPGEVISR